MQCGKMFLAVLLSLALMGMGWMGAAASSTDSAGFGEGEIGPRGISQGDSSDSPFSHGLRLGVSWATGIKGDAERDGLPGRQAAIAPITRTLTVNVRPMVTPTCTVTPTVNPRPMVTPTCTVTPKVTTMCTISPTLTVTPTREVTHPVALALATYFDVPYEEIMCWHQQGLGFGGIVKAYFLVDELGCELTVEHVLSLKLSGIGWGRIFKDFGLKPSGKGRNLGRVMSSRKRGDVDVPDATSSEEEENEPVVEAQAPDKDKAQDKTPPGQGKYKTPPGQDKRRIPPGQEDKYKGKGKGRGRGKP